MHPLLTFTYISKYAFLQISSFQVPHTNSLTKFLRFNRSRARMQRSRFFTAFMHSYPLKRFDQPALIVLNALNGHLFLAPLLSFKISNASL